METLEKSADRPTATAARLNAAVATYPARHRHLAASVGVAHDGCGIIREDARHRWQVADAARHGMAVVTTSEDRQISGAGAVNRPRFQALMRAAKARLFDVIVPEDLDRLFRSQADYHTARVTLDFHGIKIHTAAHGHVGEFDGALRALVAEQYLRDLAVHTRRGLEGVIRDGRHACERAFGFRAVPRQTR